MTEDQVKKGQQILHNIEKCNKQLRELRIYGGNKWWIGYGHDKTHSNELNVNTSQFEKIMNLMEQLKKEELEQLEKQLKEL